MNFTSFIVCFLVVFVGIFCQLIAGSPVKQVNCEQENPDARQKCNVSVIITKKLTVTENRTPRHYPKQMFMDIEISIR